LKELVELGLRFGGVGSQTLRGERERKGRRGSEGR